MSPDLLLKLSCSGCASTADLYGSNCKHMTLCLSCAKTMVENGGTCYECGAVVDRLIREYNVRANAGSEKNYFIGRFVTGLPGFSSKKKNAGASSSRWVIQKEGLQGRQVTDSLREKCKNRPWLLEDDTGLYQYQGQLEGSQSATYYLLVMQGKEFVAIPAGSWYNFNKVAQYKQLTLEEAEEKMKNRKKTADGYQRWMMKAAPAAFGEADKSDDKDVSSATGGRSRNRDDGDDDAADDKAAEDEDAEAARKSRLGLNKKGGSDDDDLKAPDLELDDDDADRGDDWEHEEIFTDDDEAVGVDPDEREDLVAPEVPAPPEIKEEEQEEEEEEEEANGEEGSRKLSRSGKELKKLLGRAAGLDDSNEDDDDGDDDDDDDEEDAEEDEGFASKGKEEVGGGGGGDDDTNSPSKAGIRGTPPKSSVKAASKRKLNGDDVKEAVGGTPPPVKKWKADDATPSKSVGGSHAPTGPVTEDEIRAVLLQKAPVTTQDLVAKFKARLKSVEDKNAFAAILRRISKIQKTNGPNFVVLRDAKTKDSNH